MHWSSNHKEVDFEVLYIYDIFLLKAALALSVNCGMPELKSYIMLLYYAESVVKSLSWKHCVRKCC